MRCIQQKGSEFNIVAVVTIDTRIPLKVTFFSKLLPVLLDFSIALPTVSIADINYDSHQEINLLEFAPSEYHFLLPPEVKKLPSYSISAYIRAVSPMYFLGFF